MTRIVGKTLVWFGGLLLFQVGVLSNLDAGNMIIPFVYPMVLFQLPRNTARWILLLLAFGIGSLTDIFIHSFGTHAFTLTLIAYIRPYILDPIAPRDSAAESMEPTVQNLGFQRFITYSGILLLIHHFFVFSIDEFDFNAPLHFVGRWLLSALVSLLLMLTLQYIFNKKTT